jgi:hypothetical protein
VDRLNAWLREDPVELRRSAAEWRALGYHAYASYLEAWADGQRPALVRRPF